MAYSSQSRGSYGQRGGYRGQRGGYRGHRGGYQRYDIKESNDVFPVKRAYEYSGAAPHLGTPSVIGNYSIDGNREFGYDRSMLQFLKKKYLPETKINVHLDLNKGLKEAVEYKGNPQETFENFLQWVFNNQDDLMDDKTSSRLSADILCMRGTLKRIMKTPYNPHKQWTLLVTEFKGSLYMMNWKTDDGTKDDYEVPRNVGFWGHKFEQYMKGVDCADSEEFEEDYQDLRAFVTVKCSRENTEEHKMRNYRRFKLCDWWVENKLSGIPRIIVGFRNDDGIVHTLELLKTEELPEQGENHWEPAVCINFIIAFLKFVKKRVGQDPSVVYRFDHIPKGDIECTKLSESSHLMLLPSWYTKKLFKADEDTDEE
ncbi:decapping and exoribonuclease protein-like isoform X2 [Penaeus chinensis]|uniref:decapping and exoribonuclease protein-like isoform X2 n=1 Tax=Penaeus chinensis TaxID=139456 RepID=UPI001FB6A8A1|nr:decapping and exoribonuclease protein-like isoform X2 [Penaeus chinensis]